VLEPDVSTGQDSYPPEFPTLPNRFAATAATAMPPSWPPAELSQVDLGSSKVDLPAGNADWCNLCQS
jgi:hypothetical protein